MKNLPRILPCLLLLTFLLSPSFAQQADTRATVSTALNQAAYTPGSRGAVAVVFDVKPGFHSQSATPSQPTFIPFTITTEPASGVELLTPQYPEGHVESYPGLGQLHVYTGKVVAFVPFEVKADAPAGEVTVKARVRYQICDDKVCFPPKTVPVTATVRVVTDPAQAQPNEPALFEGLKQAQAPPAEGRTESSAAVAAPTTAPVAANVAGSSMSTAAAFTMAIFVGLLFNVMPCVLPVLPLKAIGFYEVSQHQRSRSLLLGFVFAAGLISVFVVLALLVLVFQVVSWGGMFQKAWFVWGIVGLLLVLGFGLLGGWNLSLPMGVYRIEPRHDTLGGNYFWGALTAVLATPCTAPLLPVLLLWAAAQPAFVGVTAMVLVGVGMALPYVILSAFPELARRFPRTGPWAELFKQMMGFLLLGSAMYFAAGRLVHGPDFWWLVTAVVAIACVYLMARTVQLSKEALPVGISSTVAVMLLGGMIWWSAGMQGGGEWTPYSQQAFADARASGKPVLVKFTANWCATCQVIERSVFQDAEVWRAIEGGDVVALKVDLTDEGAPGTDLLLSLNPTGGIPLTAIYAPRAEQPIQLSSVYTSDTLLGTLASLRDGQPSPTVQTAARVAD